MPNWQDNTLNDQPRKDRIQALAQKAWTGHTPATDGHGKRAGDTLLFNGLGMVIEDIY